MVCTHSGCELEVQVLKRLAMFASRMPQSLLLTLHLSTSARTGRAYIFTHACKLTDSGCWWGSDPEQHSHKRRKQPSRLLDSTVLLAEQIADEPVTFCTTYNMHCRMQMSGLPLDFICTHGISPQGMLQGYHQASRLYIKVHMHAAMCRTCVSQSRSL